MVLQLNRSSWAEFLQWFVFQIIPESGGEKFEEEITMTRLYVSRMKSDVKQLANKCSTLKTLQEESSRKLEENEQELAASQLLIQQVKGEYCVRKLFMTNAGGKAGRDLGLLATWPTSSAQIRSFVKARDSRVADDSKRASSFTVSLNYFQFLFHFEIMLLELLVCNTVVIPSCL